MCPGEVLRMLAEECSRESPGSRHLENTESAPLTDDVYLFLGVLPRENICAPPPPRIISDR